MPSTTPKTKKAKKAAVRQTMREFKEGDLHGGSKTGPKVKSRKQAVAIAMNQSGQSRGGSRKKGYRERMDSAEL